MNLTIFHLLFVHWELKAKTFLFLKLMIQGQLWNGLEFMFSDESKIKVSKENKYMKL